MSDTSNTPLPPASSPAAPRGGVGVLLVNLGTPEAPEEKAVRAYLREFLSDRRVIETPRALWWLILNLFILPKRPAVKARDYAKIWNRERDESPLKTITRSQAEQLAAASAGRFSVEWAMRYGKPAIGEGLNMLMQKGCERILLVPLYPQYSASTTATVCDEAFRALSTMRRQPALRVAPPYYDHPAYIDALAECITEDTGKLDFAPDVLLVSFHGVPRDYVDKGDPYEQHCRTTFRMLQEKLGRADDAMVLSFQSRFGRAPWLQPYTDETVKALARKGVKRLAAVAPGFSADCLETLEELDGENRGNFLDTGGERFAYLPALNDRPQGLRLIRTLVEQELQGWA
ncbi:MAG: ferrochelatase [Methylobacteriaceae bacterium]|jgi:ferrochelatase|nr:ferrochelatase [Methylobacteriaceae bacterium]